MRLAKVAIQRMLESGHGWGADVRPDIPEREFGALAGWFCEGYTSKALKHYPCGPVWEEPDSVCTYRGCGFENYSGPEPDEWEAVCPECGGHDVFECDGHDLKFKVTNRRKHGYRVHRH